MVQPSVASKKFEKNFVHKELKTPRCGDLDVKTVIHMEYGTKCGKTSCQDEGEGAQC